MAILAWASPSQAVLSHSPPDEYYPAYPGTWWEYEVKTIQGGDTTTDTLRRNVAAAYRLHRLHDSPSSGCPAESTFVPVADEMPPSYSQANRERAVYGTSRWLGTFAGCARLVEFLKKEKSSTHWVYQAESRTTACRLDGFYCTIRWVLSTDTAIMVDTVRWDSLLHVREAHGFQRRTVDEFYRKGVGLVRLVAVDSQAGTRREETLKRHALGADGPRGQVILPLGIAGMGSSGMPLAYAGNAWTHSTPGYPPIWDGLDLSLEVHPAHVDDTLEVRVRTTSRLTPAFSLKSGDAVLLDDGLLVLPFRWQGLRLEVRQEGDAEYAPAPVLEQRFCTRPLLKPRFDSADGRLKLEGFPDSLIRWVWSGEPGGSLEDTMGSGSTHAPARSGRYGARIAAGAFSDSLCGLSPYLFSEDIQVNGLSLAGVGLSGVPWKLRLFGAPVVEVLLEAGAEPTLEIFDVGGKRLRSLQATRGNGVLTVSAHTHTPAPGIYLYTLRAGRTHHRGRVVVVRP